MWRHGCQTACRSNNNKGALGEVAEGTWDVGKLQQMGESSAGREREGEN